MQCLKDFVEAQMIYYTSCTSILNDLGKDIGIKPIQNSSSGASAANVRSPLGNTEAAANPSMFSAIFGDSSAIDTGVKPALVDPKKAKVLFDYDAVEPIELSVWANQVSTIFFFFLFRMFVTCYQEVIFLNFQERMLEGIRWVKKNIISNFGLC